MNSSFQRVSVETLPEALTKALQGSKVLKCFYASDNQRYIVWVLNDASKRQQELEYDVQAASFLSRSDRDALLDSPFNIEYPDLNVNVEVSYALEADTDVLHEELVVYSVVSGKPITSGRYVVFNPFKMDRKKEVAKLVEKAAFPDKYHSWSRQEKVNYWSELLYRLRHQAGEDNASPDSVFTGHLIKHMTELDASIINLLPAILNELAKMEMIAAGSLFTAFTARTQINLSVPA